MTMEFSLTTESVRLAAGAVGIAVPDIGVQRLVVMGQSLLRWRQTHNVLGPCSEDEMVVKHLVDSITPLRLSRVAAAESIIDLGSGAGLPGLPLAASKFPPARVTLVDSQRKACEVAEAVAAETGLDGVTTIRRRAEVLGRTAPYRGGFEVATARAVAPLAVLVELALPFLKLGGIFVALKGPAVDGELSAAENALEILGGRVVDVDALSLPGGFGQRRLVVIEKESPTPERYPRRPGIPAKRPL